MYLVNRDEIRLWLSYIIGAGYDVIGTLSHKGQVAYDRILSCEDFAFKDLPPINELQQFLMAKEIKAGFDRRQGSEVDIYSADRPQIFLGIRECDMAAIKASADQGIPDYDRHLNQSQFYVFDCRELLDEECFCCLLHEKDYEQADGVLYSFIDGYCLDLKSQASKTLFAAFLRANTDVLLEQVQYSQSGWLYQKASEDQLDFFRYDDQVKEVCIQHLQEDQLCVGCGRCTRDSSAETKMKDIALRAMNLKV